MARQTGSNNFAGTLEILAGGPIDARTIVPTKADLLASGTFPYPYIGMIVSVISEAKAYMLTSSDTTIEANWQEIGSGSGSGVSDFDDLTNRPEAIKTFTPSILPNVAGGKLCSYDPIGTIIAFMGTTAPDNYLACDGTIYNIADYQNLADFFTEQFGSANYFGGDGTTPFAVPDLRGEFLRGTGTNSHTNQGSGASVGVHQDGTAQQNVYCTMDNDQIQAPAKSFNPVRNVDKKVSTGDYIVVSQGTRYNYAGETAIFTSRPTNTSILYCIKYKADEKYQLIFDDKERVVGEWFGKKLYQKTVVGNLSTGITENREIVFENFTSSGNILHNAFGTVEWSSGGVGRVYMPWYLQSANRAMINLFQGNIVIEWASSSFAGQAYEITIQYTKTS